FKQLRVHALQAASFSTKKAGDPQRAGQYGEGIKVAACNAIRDGWTLDYIFRDRRGTYVMTDTADPQLAIDWRSANHNSEDVHAILRGGKGSTFEFNPQHYLFLLDKTFRTLA